MTLKDVAAACGLSHTAVSLALRGSAQIPPATRERVLKVAVDLRYVPDESARRLKGAPAGKIAYVSARLAHGFVGQVLVGMEQRAFDTQRYFNNILPYSTWFQSHEKERVLEQILRGGLADAVVMVSLHPGKALKAEFIRHGVPLVLVEEHDRDFHSVRVDNVLGAKMATQHLVRQGCKKVGLVAGIVGGAGMDINPTAVERRKGFELGLKATGARLDKKRIIDVGYYDVATGPGALDRMLKADPGVDGIVCAAGDLVALGIMKRARELKIKIPSQLKLTGYDDIEFAALTSPGLTTVRQPVAQLGAQAFDLAVQAADGKLSKPTHMVFKPEMVLRGSA